MRKILKFSFILAFAFLITFSLVACGKSGGEGGKECSVAEKVELGKTMLGEVEFENSDEVELKQDCGTVTISGTIDAMSDSQKSAYGVEDVTHVAVVKFMFDKERTLSSFEIKGNTTKVFSDDDSKENYAGTLTDLLDNESGEDAFTYLILSANTKEYTLTTVYTDDTESVISLKINATLATATAE